MQAHVCGGRVRPRPQLAVPRAAAAPRASHDAARTRCQRQPIDIRCCGAARQPRDHRGGAGERSTVAGRARRGMPATATPAPVPPWHAHALSAQASPLVCPAVVWAALRALLQLVFLGGGGVSGQPSPLGTHTSTHTRPTTAAQPRPHPQADLEEDRTAVAQLLKAPMREHGQLVQGQLSNGLRYVVLPNKTPPERFEAHLEIHAGSVDEQEHEQVRKGYDQVACGAAGRSCCPAWAGGGGGSQWRGHPLTPPRRRGAGRGAPGGTRHLPGQQAAGEPAGHRSTCERVHGLPSHGGCGAAAGRRRGGGRRSSAVAAAATAACRRVCVARRSRGIRRLSRSVAAAAVESHSAKAGL